MIESNDVVKSAIKAAYAATQGWVRVIWKNRREGYRIRRARNDLPKRPWLELDRGGVLNLAFQGRIITPEDEDHRLILQLGCR
jgi:hypothetical protein